MNAKIAFAAAFLSTAAIFSVPASAQIAGGTLLSPNVAELATGWSAKKQILGKTVYNEEKKAVGKIEDVIIAPDRKASFVIIGAGGFVGLGRHDVAIAASSLSEMDGKIVLPGATKEAIKAMPKFEYLKSR
jgi:sporulation protein YlmC with PRC-barrel domain